MSNHNNRQLLPPLGQEPGSPRPIEQLHPVLLGIVERMGMLPLESRESMTQGEIATAVSLAIAMLPVGEQAYITSRIMTYDEIAEEKPPSPRVQDLEHPIPLSGSEIWLSLQGSPKPEHEESEVKEEDRCVACYSKSEASLPCGCRYCGHCYRKSIRIGLRSELDFPPSCCGIPFDEATIRLAKRPALVWLFCQLRAEYDVEPGERLYCHDPRCSSFIPPRVIQPAARDEDNATPVGTCLACHKTTCATCGSRSHRGLPCREEEEDDDALLDMMDSQGLVGCPKCGIVIALRDGCNHMSCLCGAEFCYICGHEWSGGCRCPDYNGFSQRVPVRQRPGRRPILRGGRAHLVSDTDRVPKIPQLRYEPEDEVALAAADYAPINASVEQQ